MARNERTSTSVASIASQLLRNGKGTPAQIRKVAASALTQRPDNPRKSK